MSTFPSSDDDSSGIDPEQLQRFRELIRRCRQRDPRAQAELFDEYGPVIRGYVRAKFTQPWLRRFFDSEEVMLTAMRAALHNLTPSSGYEFATPRNFVNFLITIAERKFIDYLRQVVGRDGKRPLALGDAGLGAVKDAADPALAAELHEFRQRLLEAREFLGPDARWLLDLRLADEPAAEIRNVTGWSEQEFAAVRMRLLRGLREALRQWGFADVLDEEDDA